MKGRDEGLRLRPSILGSVNVNKVLPRRYKHSNMRPICFDRIARQNRKPVNEVGTANRTALAVPDTKCELK